MRHYVTASRATRGARAYQEDTAAVRAMAGEDAAAPETTADAPVGAATLLAVLADGMGGHAGGSVASRLVCEGFLASFAGAAAEQPTAGRLLAALESCNRAVADRIEVDPMLSGMGSTLIGALFGPDGVAWISVGDSPLFLFRRGDVALLNEDHSLAPELDRLAAAGRISQREALNDPRRHMLRSAVCGDDIELIDIAEQPVPLAPGDFVILASDGLETLEPAEIARIVAAYADAGAAGVAEALIRSVDNLRDPHQDNATVIVVEPRGA